MTTTLEKQDFTNLSIPTDLGGFSIAELRAMGDLDTYGPDALIDQVAAAAAVARVTEDLGDTARTIRDMAGLLLIEPYQSVQRPYDAAMERIAKALDAGRITPAVANTRRAKASIERRKGMEAIPDAPKPVHVYRDVIGVSRGLFVRMQHRKPEQLPTVREFVSRHQIYKGDDQPVTLAEVAEIGREKRAECVMYDTINKDARTIRDEVGALLLNGDKKRGVKAMSNADFARLTKLTTARVAQIRYGGR